MRWELIHNAGSGNLILIFAGWSTDSSFYSAIEMEGWDIAVVSDYSDFSFPLERLEGYSTIVLFAWSLGVYAAASVLPFDRISIAVAINGTEFPAHDSFGIPETIYDSTASTLSERNLMKFRRRMSGGAYETLKDRFGNTPADIECLRHQLEFIRQSATDGMTAAVWHRVYISTDDHIFPPANQRKAWESHPSSPEIIEIEAPHYVDLQPIVRSVLPSGEKVGERFHKALPTYNSQATAQRKIAEHLTRLCPTGTQHRVIEIGPGTGLFSRMITGKCNPEIMEYIDLYPTDRFHLAPNEVYHLEDAEKWMAREAGRNNSSADAIVSASAIQWFVNPARFFGNAAKILKPGGLLLCSTFLPGNLHEIKAVNPHGLIYHGRKEIERMLSLHFKEFTIEEETITLDFASPRDALLHLRQTGVGGASSSGLPLKDMLAKLPPRLTYRPLYILAYR